MRAVHADKTESCRALLAADGSYRFDRGIEPARCGALLCFTVVGCTSEMTGLVARYNVEASTVARKVARWRCLSCSLQNVFGRVARRMAQRPRLAGVLDALRLAAGYRVLRLCRARITAATGVIR